MLSLDSHFLVQVDVDMGPRYIKIVNFSIILTPFFMGFPGFYEVARLWATSPSVGYLLLSLLRGGLKRNSKWVTWNIFQITPSPCPKNDNCKSDKSHQSKEWGIHINKFSVISLSVILCVRIFLLGAILQPMLRHKVALSSDIVSSWSALAPLGCGCNRYIEWWVINEYYSGTSWGWAVQALAQLSSSLRLI